MGLPGADLPGAGKGLRFPGPVVRFRFSGGASGLQGLTGLLGCFGITVL